MTCNIDDLVSGEWERLIAEICRCQTLQQLTAEKESENNYYHG